MKYLHIDWINGLCVQFNQKLVLVLVHSNDEGTLNFSFIDPLTDEPVLTEDEERRLLLSLMQEQPNSSQPQYEPANTLIKREPDLSRFINSIPKRNPDPNVIYGASINLLSNKCFGVWAGGAQC